MSFLDRLFSWNGPRAAPVEEARPQNAYSIATITPGSMAWDDFFASPSGAQYPSEATAFTVSAIYACVNLYAGAIASLVKHIYRVDTSNGERDRLYTDPLWWVLNEEMAPRWSAANGWEFIIQSLLLHGDGFARIIRDRAGMPVGLKPMHPGFVVVAVNVDADRLVYIYSPQEMQGKAGEQLVLDQDDVVHIAGFGFDGLRGMSPLRYSLREAGSVAMSAQKYSNAFFSNSARPDFALRTEQKLTPDAIENLRAQIAENHQGVDKAHKPMVLQGGLDLKTITMPVKDIMLIETRQFQIEEIARIYGVPPFMIGYNEKTTSWGSGVEAMGTGFVRFSLRQHLNKIETELNRKLFRTAAKRIEFDTFDLERADMKSMFEAFRIGIGRAGEPGFISVDEARMRLNMKRQPDGELNPGMTAAPAAPTDPTQVTP